MTKKITQSITKTRSINIMLQNYKKFVVFALLLTCFHGVHSKVFIVYPFKESESQPKFPMPKFGIDILKSQERSNDTHYDLVYPTNENIVTMTPEPIEKYDINDVAETTTTQELFDELVTSTQISESDTTVTPMVMEPLETTTTTTQNDFDSRTTDFKTIAFSTTKLYTTESSSTSLQVFEETGPKKTLRKRMFELRKFSRKYPSGLKMSSEPKLPTTKSPAIIFKNWYRDTRRNKFMTVPEKLGKTSNLKNFGDEVMTLNIRRKSNTTNSKLNKDKQFLKILTG